MMANIITQLHKTACMFCSKQVFHEDLRNSAVTKLQHCIKRLQISSRNFTKQHICLAQHMCLPIVLDKCLQVAKLQDWSTAGRMPSGGVRGGKPPRCLELIMLHFYFASLHPSLPDVNLWAAPLPPTQTEDAGGQRMINPASGLHI